MGAKIKNYFVYNGNRYYEGTIVKFNKTPYVGANYGKYTGTAKLFTAMNSPTEYAANGNYLFELKAEDAVQVVNPIAENQIEYVKAYKDTDSNDMFYAWVAYIAVMLFFAICNGRIFGWIAATIVFISYRHNKLYVTKRSYDDKNRNGGI